jgi:hypothetical protein
MVMGAYVEILKTLSYDSTKPAGHGVWDSANFTWDVFGPAATNGPVGNAGPDGTPGNADDRYALEPWGTVRFVPGVTAAFAMYLPAFMSAAPAATSPSLEIACAPSMRAIESAFVAPTRRVATVRTSRE